MTDGERYAEKHRGELRGHRRGQAATREIKNLISAIARLIDHGELQWDAKTDGLYLTPYGHEVADKMSWYWDQKLR